MPSFEYLSRGFRVFVPTTFGLLAAGCSADVARFDFPGSASFADSQTNSIPIPPATVHSPGPRAGLIGDQGGEPLPPPAADYGAPPRDVRVAELPPVSGTPPQGQPYARDYDRGYQDRSNQGGGYQDRGSPQGYRDRGSQSPGYETTQVRSYDAAPRSRIPVAPRAEQLANDKQGGEQIEVKPGDTLFGLSRRHNVSVSALTEANDLKGRSLKPGQRLTIPSSEGARRHTSAKLDAAPPAVEPAADATSAVADTTTADAAGTYTMKPGDSLYAIARKHNVKFAELQQQNGITDVRKVRPGTVLKIPGVAGASAGPSEQATASPSSGSPAAAVPSQSEASATSNSAESPKVLNASSPPSAPSSTAVNGPVTAPPAAPAEPEKRVAAVDPQTSTATPVMASERTPQDKSSVRLRWPVQGKIISQFGPRADGTHNDGVNFSVPLGTEVHAAEDGEVIYVGDELKAYGKLVLVRHDNGWVTAYAHNDELAVKRGDKVRRGQVVAKAGKSGPVDQPQVHFELRQDSKAVDPTSYMEKL